MPELPEVETWRRLAERHVAGKRIARVYAPADPVIFDRCSAATFKRRQQGRCIEGVHRRGKHLWFELDKGPSPYVHFGMTGSFSVYEHLNERPRFLKAEWLMEDGTRLGYSCIRKIGKLRLYTDILTESPVSSLGPDPLHDVIDLDSFTKTLQSRKAPVKSILLDQRVVAGVGNWIADEILYQAGINPHTRGSELPKAQLQKIHRVLLRIIRKAVAVEADAGRFPKGWLFHKRWGKNTQAQTSTGAPIIFDTIGGRTTAWVPEIQRFSAVEN